MSNVSQNKTVVKETIDDKDEFTTDTKKLERTEQKYKDSDKAFKKYDPALDTSKYPVYRNDIKYKVHRNVDPSRALWDEDVKKDFHGKDTDSIEYRLEECIREKYSVLDLSHMDKKCFEKLFNNKVFLSLMSKIQHLFAKDCHLRSIPSLKLLTNLQTLDISCNKLKELPELPETIEELIVNDNRLTAINNKLPNLKRLNCDNNDISVIVFPEALERVHSKNNPIPSIPNLDNLYYLDVSETKIEKIGSFPKLKQLLITSTKIEAVTNLEELELLQCNFSNIKTISGVPNMKSIEMVGTNIENLPFFPSLERITYTQSNKFKLSNRYKMRSVKKNKNNVNEIIFCDTTM